MDRQSDGYEQAKSDNTRLCDQLSSAQEHGKEVSSELAKKNSDINELEKKLQLEQEEKCNKVSVYCCKTMAQILCISVVRYGAAIEITSR